MKEPVYRPIVPDGMHLADSGKTPGAKLGAALDDNTNQVAGQADWIEVKQNPLADIIGYALVAGATVVTTIVVQKSAPAVKDWFQSTTLPSAKAALRRLTRAKEEATARVDAVEAVEPIQLDSVGFSQEIETVLEGARRPISSAEVKRRLLRIMLTAAVIAEELRALDGVKIRDDEDLRELQRAMGELTTQEVADLANQMLVEADTLLDEEDEAAFVAVFGGGRSAGGTRSLIESDRLREALRLPDEESEEDR
ncbi:hypothetical protein [Leucobacter tenebrionis]|uniref:hypothetical protein n=1 Tax=Leucobacter tenebrionis TaxID=2873270 RepID=UPI001CA78701|nr:hypothetical protein [Leucobacter tenebrionis]QZY52273.1 hypothetical protein KVY00_02030 [Leucobacter tenebrionis]